MKIQILAFTVSKPQIPTRKLLGLKDLIDKWFELRRVWTDYIMNNIYYQ